MLQPMLAKVFQGDIHSLNNGYWFEIKYDGGRVIADNTCKYGTPVLWSRRGNHLNNQFPSILKELAIQQKAIFDCEVVVFDKFGISDFTLYQRRNVSNPLEIQQREKLLPATLMIFDILWLNGNSLSNLSLQERYKILKATLKQTEHIRLTPHYETPEKLLQMHNIEGIMIKKTTAGYLEGKRAEYWQKLKFNQEATVTIVSYEKHPAGILMISKEGWRINCNGQQSNIGKKLLDKKQEFKIEIAYLEKTADNKLRFPSFKRYVDADVM